MLRQYLPKGADLSVFTQDDREAIADSMVSLPRATHSWHPSAAFCPGFWQNLTNSPLPFNETAV